MALSTTLPTAARERDNIIAASLRRIGVLRQGQTASSADISAGAISLNYILKSLDSIPLFKSRTGSTEYSVGVTDGTSLVTLSANIISVTSASIKITSTSPATVLEFALKELSAEEYTAIIDKDEAGVPTHIYISYDLDTPVAYLYPVTAVDANLSFSLTYRGRNRVKTMSASSDQIDLQDEWVRYIVLKLSADLSFEYRLPEMAAIMIQEAATALSMVLTREGTQMQAVPVTMEGRVQNKQEVDR